MTLQQLTYALAAARHGSFSASSLRIWSERLGWAMWSAAAAAEKDP